ncbi:MAG: diguanylate cyclase [Candidatus Zixiibacteriota bacterium]|nr:MAG: diguanylate cyclase [candidate division Zixibacteria bacterium]
MQNIENITLENWPVSGEGRLATSPAYHFAVKQTGVNLDFHVKQFFHGDEISFHFFQTFDELSQICLRYPVDVILIAGKSLFLRELEIVRAIKRHVVVSIVPVVLYHPDPDRDVVVASYENGAEDFIFGEWIARLVDVRIRRVIERSRRDLAVNPTTRLPGPGMIEREIEQQMSTQEEFAICYVDLDNFKAFNDYYGYAYGDRIIRMVGRMIKDIVYDLCKEAFVGHIAGDDFLYLVPRDLVEPTCEWIIKCFDAFIPYRYDEDDRERGYIETQSRRDAVERFPILSLSIAVIINEQGKFQHVGELSRMLADLKKACKARPGSNYMIERRKKY